MIGQRVGHYEVTARLGEGGMGEVYRARDTKLDRDVAVKVLPEALAHDPERLARLEREAKVLASLNHPNIAQVYGLETSPATRAIVMELVDGPTLSEVIGRAVDATPSESEAGQAAGVGPRGKVRRAGLSLDDALPIAKQIAAALEAAHEAGVIHRDLKPANIKVKADGTVKVLDFGLAKALEPAPADAPGLSGLANSPTVTSPAMTAMGVILGTAAYMAPEQARGRQADRRADIWAFGAVLYEMLTGRPAFPGDDISQTLARVIDREPDWSAIPGNLPPGLMRYLQRCLEKDPKQRVQSIGDVRLALAGAFEPQMPAAPGPPPTGRTLPSSWQMAALGVAGLIAGVGVATLSPWGSVSEDPPRVGRFSIPVEEGFAGNGRTPAAISPNGRRIAYVSPGSSAGSRTLFVRALDDLDATAVASLARISNPFFSTDSEWVGFWADGRLMKTSVERLGTPLALTDMAEPFGASWGADDVILVGQGPAGISRVPGTGGKAERIIALEPGEAAHGPQMLPDGEWVLYTLRPRGVASWDQAQVVVHSLATGERRLVAERGRDARYLPTGHLVYGLGNTLVGVPYDVRAHRASGPVTPLVDDVSRSVGVQQTGAVHFGVSDDGTLVYLPGEGRISERPLIWVDREGTETPAPLPARDYGVVRISPDGARAAMSIADASGWNIWIAEFDRGTLSPLANSDADEISPLWTLDGKAIVFASDQQGTWAFYQRAADGTGPVTQLIGFETEITAPSTGAWSPDGKRLAFEYESSTTSSMDVGVVVLDDPPSWAPLVNSQYEEGAPAISPDGRWMAYSSTEGGQRQVWLQRFPGLGDRRLVSPGRGMDPIWSKDGLTLFFRAGVGAPPPEMTAVSIGYDPVLSIGRPTILFDKQYYRQPASARFHDLSPADGRFLMLASAPDSRAAAGLEASVPSLVVVQNWFTELRARVPTP